MLSPQMTPEAPEELVLCDSKIQFTSTKSILELAIKFLKQEPTVGHRANE